MSKLNFLFSCDTAMIARNNNLSIIGIFDTITADKFPATHPKMAIVLNVTIDDEEVHSLSYSIRKEKNEIIHVENAGIQGRRDHQWINHLAMVTFPEEGEYVIDVKLDKKVIGSRTLLLQKVDESATSV